MSASVQFSSGPDTKVRVNAINPPKELNIVGAGVTVVDNTVDNRYDVTITGAGVGLATTTVAGVVELATDGENAANVVVQGNDSRLSNARTPTTHASTHKSGGSDPIKLDELAATTDVNTLNSSTSAHGLLRKLSGNATEYQDGSGNWSTPAGTGGTGEANTYSNAGLAGIPIILTKTGVDLPFKAIDAATNKISVTNDATNKTVDIDVTEANLSIANQTGSIGDARITDLAYTKLTSVPSTIVKTDQANTFGAFDQTIPSTRLKLSNSGFTSIISVGTLGGSTTLTLPSTTDTIVGRATTDTLTNKTLTTPIISSISNTGTLTLPTATTTIIGTDTTDTLTNKTVNATNNTITDTSTSLGDILKSNGTKFVRLGRGSANQILTVNGAASDILWSDPATSTVVKYNYSYLVYYTGTQFVAVNGSTGVNDFSNTTDGAAVLNSAITSVNTAGGGVIVIQGTILCRSSVILKPLVEIVGAGEGASIKQDATQNLAVLIDSANFATLTGTGSTAGVYSVYLENLLIDGNKANNTTTATIGLRCYGYNWHVKHVHIKSCKGIGHYSEWSTDPVSPSTGTTMNSYYDTLTINLCDGVGWQMRGPHDSQINNSTIYSCGGVAFLQEYLATKYDGSCEMTQVHIFDCPGKGVDAKGGTFRFRGLTTESITSSGIGLHQEGAIVEGVNFESYNNTTGLKLESGGISAFSGSWVHDNTTDGVEILKNDVMFDGTVMSNATKGIVLGSASINIANTVLNCYIFGHSTANIDWAHAGNQGVTGTCLLYNDSTNQIPILNSSNIDFDKNTLAIETLANGTATKYADARALLSKQAVKSPMYKKTGSMFVGHNAIFKDGLFTSIVETSPTAATYNNTDQWFGLYANYSTGTTINSKAGLNGGTGTVTIFTRTSNPYFTAHIKAPTVTNTRFYGGFSSATALPVTDAPLASADSGIIVGWNSTDTNIKIYNNDGTAAAPTAVDTGIAKPNSPFTFEIQADDSAGKFTVRVIAPAGTFTSNITTRIPSSSTRLAVYCCIENSTAANVTLNLDTAYLESKFVQ